jgi:hypothetical protein
MDRHGQLTLIPLPSFSEMEYHNVVKDPERYLSYEYFIPNGPSGIQKLSFPYTWTVLKCLQNFHIRAILFGIPLYSDHRGEGRGTGLRAFLPVERAGAHIEPPRRSSEASTRRPPPASHFASIISGLVGVVGCTLVVLPVYSYAPIS